jgi:hypothetical protein
MTIRFQVRLIVWSLLTSSACCFAQGLESLPDAALTNGNNACKTRGAGLRSSSRMRVRRRQILCNPKSRKLKLLTNGR